MSTFNHLKCVEDAFHVSARIGKIEMKEAVIHDSALVCCVVKMLFEDRGADEVVIRRTRTEIPFKFSECQSSEGA